MLRLMDPEDLGPAAVRVLKALVGAEGTDGEELACDGLSCWYGLKRTTWRVVNELLSCCFIREEQAGGGCRLFTVNESGRRFLKGLLPYTDGQGRHHRSLAELMSKN